MENELNKFTDALVLLMERYKDTVRPDSMCQTLIETGCILCRNHLSQEDADKFIQSCIGMNRENYYEKEKQV